MGVFVEMLNLVRETRYRVGGGTQFPFYKKKKKTKGKSSIALEPRPVAPVPFPINENAIEAQVRSPRARHSPNRPRRYGRAQGRIA
jgi:hypothetical protein